ncbi:amino acid ABC transporter ATP-binding protein [Paenibacillus sp. SYP-B4298]|uniref:amino acid ABC transporter ATP-binding protein n=1 Tax=Paenibacillus sp. SYP-B4298 TaxID=2996034 RepID=UPI0022DD5A47|nr:amino acid ABC transporter ATP-binding protein [Paenibacillus sp. SYP-B4298]
MLKVNGLSKHYGKHEVLKQIDLEIGRREVVAIIGPSGSGKSTLLRCLNLLETPDTGTIEIDGFAIDAGKLKKSDAYALRQKSSMVFQHYNLFKNKTALQNVIEALVVTKKMPKPDAVALGAKLLEQVGLAAKADSYPSMLSGGQQQRVAIARALAVNPAVILLDEPTSALDPELVGEVLQVIRSIVDTDTTMLIVTHEMAFAREIADRVIFMADGSIVEQGNPQQLFGSPQQERTRRFLSSFLSSSSLERKEQHDGTGS